MLIAPDSFNLQGRSSEKPIGEHCQNLTHEKTNPSQTVPESFVPSSSVVFTSGQINQIDFTRQSSVRGSFLHFWHLQHQKTVTSGWPFIQPGCSSCPENHTTIFDPYNLFGSTTAFGQLKGNQLQNTMWWFRPNRGCSLGSLGMCPQAMTKQNIAPVVRGRTKQLIELVHITQGLLGQAHHLDLLVVILNYGQGFVVLTQQISNLQTNRKFRDCTVGKGKGQALKPAPSCRQSSSICSSSCGNQ